MTICLLSFGGMPPTGGFFGKFYVFKSAMDVYDGQLLWLVVDRRRQLGDQHLLLPADRDRDVLPRGEPAVRADALGGPRCS